MAGPSCLRLEKEGLYTLLSCTFKNLSVGYLVLPLDAEETAKTTHVEVVKLSGVAGVHCPGLTGVEKGGKDHCTIHLELG